MHDTAGLGSNASAKREKCENVGIVAMEIFFPPHYVNQSDLEKHDGVSTGKYTIGLGQQRMAVPTEADDVNSICLSVVSSLFTKYAITPQQIGRLEVGTESIIDKSKSVKSTLMQLFVSAEGNESGDSNSDVLGVDCINACYGGTAALFNSICWMESEDWDGRYALVVAGDISVYAVGPARPTGGVGAVAILLGPNGSIRFDRGVAGHHMEHVYDFYKPHLASEYPEVDGKLSIDCYLRSLELAFGRWNSKFNIRYPNSVSHPLEKLDYVLFHCPYVKLAQKGTAKLFYTANQMSASVNGNCNEQKQNGISNGNTKAIQTTGQSAEWSKEFEKEMTNASFEFYSQKVLPGLRCASQLGNMYTGSVFGSLISLICSESGGNLVGKRLGVFSYGSGLASSFYSMVVADDGYLKMREVLDLERRLASRVVLSPVTYGEIMERREKIYQASPVKIPQALAALYPEGSFYLEEIDERSRRKYRQIGMQGKHKWIAER